MNIIQEFAMLLNGREYGDEITPQECAHAKQDGIVVVFGCSDDNVELRGAIHDEVGAYDGTTLCFDAKGLLQNDCDDEDCPHYIKLINSAKTIKAVWNNGIYSWSYETSIPHATFLIMEDGNSYCQGIVFHMENLK